MRDQVKGATSLRAEPAPVESSSRLARHAGAPIGCLLLLTTGSTMALGETSDSRPSSGAGPPRVITLTGDYGLRPYRFAPVDRRGAMLDARSAIFTLANSRNSSPSAERPCGHGKLPINPYPISLRGAARITLLGALVRGRVPQGADWSASYCNSAAIDFKEAPNGEVDGVRVLGSWDAVRASGSSGGLTVRNAWISDVRDDALENDYLHSAEIVDTLIDGAFQGVSIKPASDGTAGDGRGNSVTLSGVLIRLAEYPYKGEMRFGALTKNSPESPRLVIRDSIVAIDYRGGRTFSDYWSRGWSKVQHSSNNALLWLSDAPVPASFPKPPNGFKMVTGEAARRLWRQARANWINCHPEVRRDRGDPLSLTRACRPHEWGGRRP